MNKADILCYLAENPGATVTQISRHFGVYSRLIRVHLGKLMESGQVYRTETSGVNGWGRPVKIHHYFLDNKRAFRG